MQVHPLRLHLDQPSQSSQQHHLHLLAQQQQQQQLQARQSLQVLAMSLMRTPRAQQQLTRPLMMQLLMWTHCMCLMGTPLSQMLMLSLQKRMRPMQQEVNGQDWQLRLHLLTQRQHHQRQLLQQTPSRQKQPHPLDR